MLRRFVIDLLLKFSDLIDDLQQCFSRDDTREVLNIFWQRSAQPATDSRTLAVQSQCEDVLERAKGAAHDHRAMDREGGS